MRITTAVSSEVSTYRSLRIGLVFAVITIGLAIGQVIATSDCAQSSISAYWYTPARTVFVGALYAAGTILIAYRGDSAVEDTLLDLAGFAAIVVAAVPTWAPSGRCGPVDLTDPTAFVDVSVPAIGGVAAAAGVLAQVLLDPGVDTRSLRWCRHRLLRRLEHAARRFGRLALSVAGTIVLLTHAVDAVGFRRDAHAVAAIGLFVAIIGVVLTQALRSRSRADSRSHAFGLGYLVVAGAMGLTLVLTILAHTALDATGSRLLIIEATLLAEFAVYWLLQTVERWQPAPDVAISSILS
ncbi:hypothetical protein [Williamsia sp. CHRR-6]|uniref:hypothetical protein n=1 Tax=Williamsia sp. CHRR-6 TaxID=2835871 RepID=UPI001BDB4942|nr:hypothetical protein [Williamsia sp. CHRR-6]MBT0567841.1 hypothetical protein [Williamsia sp. CHRR-6]